MRLEPFEKGRVQLPVSVGVIAEQQAAALDVVDETRRDPDLYALDLYAGEPFSPRMSRSTHSKGTLDSTSMECSTPLMCHAANVDKLLLGTDLPTGELIEDQPHNPLHGVACRPD